jgi:flagellar motor switch protein FliG
VIAALPDKVQAEALERLAVLGETDPESVVVVERELASWLARRMTCGKGDVRRNDTVAAILASTDALTRSQILANLRSQKSNLAEQLEPGVSPELKLVSKRRKPRSIELSHQAAACAKRIAAGVSQSMPPSAAQQTTPPRRSVAPPPPRPAAASVPSFDDLMRLDTRALAAVLREVEVDVLVLALVGSHEELAGRICEQVPKRVARTLRRQLRQVGPTRLSDIEEAQRAVSLVTANYVAARRCESVALAGT